MGTDGLLAIKKGIHINVNNLFIRIKVTFAPNLAKKISTNFYYLSLSFQLSVVNSENFKEIKAWEVPEILERKNTVNIR